MVDRNEPVLLIRAKVKFPTTFFPTDKCGEYPYLEIPIEFDWGIRRDREPIEYLKSLPKSKEGAALKEKINGLDRLTWPCREEFSLRRGSHIEAYFVRKGESISCGYDASQLDVLEGKKVIARYFTPGHEPSASEDKRRLSR